MVITMNLVWVIYIFLVITFVMFWWKVWVKEPTHSPVEIFGFLFWFFCSVATALVLLMGLFSGAYFGWWVL